MRHHERGLKKLKLWYEKILELLLTAQLELRSAPTSPIIRRRQSRA
jgi:hypothetical protein